MSYPTPSENNQISGIVEAKVDLRSEIQDAIQLGKQWSGYKEESTTPLNPAFQAAMNRPPIRDVIDEPLRIVAMEYGLGSVGYYRVGIPMYYLNKKSMATVVLLDHLPVLPELHEQLILLSDTIKWAQVVVVSRPYRYEQLRFIMSLKSRKDIVVVVECDDHLEAVECLGNNGLSLFWTKERIDIYRQGLFIADAITVASKDLAKHYKERFGEKAYYIPNPVDVRSNRWNTVWSKYPDHPFTIGVAHGHTHNRDLDIIKAPVEYILNKYPDVYFKIVGYKPDWIDVLPQKQVIIAEYADFDQFPKRLSDIDLMLCPLLEHDFNRMKTDTKLFESTMAGAACIGSPVGEFLRWKDEKQMLYASSEQDWIDKIETLVTNPQMARDLNKEAIRFVVQFRSADVLASMWYACYRQALENKSKQSNVAIPYGSRSAIMR